MLVVGMLVIGNVYFSYSPFVSTYKWLKVAEIAFLAYFVASWVKTKRSLGFDPWLLIPAGYSCVLAIWQFFNHGSVGGLWYFLGERAFTFDTPGISPWRPYATFSHPNVLMGFLVVSETIILTNLPHFSRKITALVLVLVVFVLILLPTRGNLLNGWELRQQLNGLAVQQWAKSPVFGTGLGTSPLYPRNVTNFAMLRQPIHNIYLLVLSETGIVGFFLFGLLIIGNLLRTGNWKLKISFLVIIILGFFDHYWLTQQQTQLLLAIVLGIIAS